MITVYGTEKDAKRVWDYYATTIILPRPWWKRFLAPIIPAYRERRVQIGPVIELVPALDVSSDNFIFIEVDRPHDQSQT